MRMAQDARNVDLAARAGIFLLREADRAKLDQVAKDTTLLNAVHAKGLHPSTESLRRQVLERDLQQMFRSIANQAMQLSGVRQPKLETSRIQE